MVITIDQLSTPLQGNRRDEIYLSFHTIRRVFQKIDTSQLYKFWWLAHKTNKIWRTPSIAHKTQKWQHYPPLHASHEPLEHNEFAIFLATIDIRMAIKHHHIEIVVS